MGKTRSFVAGVAAGLMGIVLAVPAAADPDGDYLNQLGNTPGFTVNGFTSGLLLNAGNTICADLRGGMTPEDSAQKMLFYPGSSIALTRVMVAAAQQTMCPDTLHR